MRIHQFDTEHEQGGFLGDTLSRFDIRIEGLDEHQHYRMHKGLKTYIKALLPLLTPVESRYAEEGDIEAAVGEQPDAPQPQEVST